MALRLITSAAATPVSLPEAKKHLRVDHTDDDTLIEGYIAAATGYLDGWSGILGRCMVSQTWELVLDRFPANEIKIPLGDLLSVVSVKYDDTEGAEQTFPAEEYEVDTVNQPGWVLPVGSWPPTYDTVNAVRVQFTAGYGDAAAVPPAIKTAILLLVGNWYENREAATEASLNELPFGVSMLLAPYRRVSL